MLGVKVFSFLSSSWLAIKFNTHTSSFDIILHYIVHVMLATDRHKFTTKEPMKFRIKDGMDGVST